MATVVKMPKWGLMTEGTVGAWLQAEGAVVAEGDPLVTIETDKAVDDVGAPIDGTLIRIVAATGEEVLVAGPVAIIAAPGETLSDEDIAALIAESQPVSHVRKAREPRRERETRSSGPGDGGRVNASPAARKRAGELGVDLAEVVGTGPGGRITTDDVESVSSDLATPEPALVTISLADGRVINAMVAGPRGAPPVVLLHGLSGSYASWQMIIAALIERYHLIAIDLPGHGESDKSTPETTDYSVTGLAEAVTETLDAMGVRSATVAGHSLGGAIASAIAKNRPDLVQNLILVDSAGLGSDIAPTLLTLMAGAGGTATAKQMLELFFEDQRFVLDRAIDDMARAHSAPNGWSAQQAVAGAVFADGEQRADHLTATGTITQPVLIIWGERDRVIPAAHAVSAAQTLPDATVALLSGIGHVPQVEAADRVAVLIDRFVKSLAP